METSLLNKAHYEGRRAKSFVSTGRFAEAVECHLSAYNLLKQLLEETQHESVVESLKAQQEDHIRQIQIVRFKQLQLQKYKKTLSNYNRQMAAATEKNSEAEEMCTPALLPNINRAFEQHDSLVEQLIHRYQPNDTPEKKTELQKSAFKMPKENTEVTEELRMCNRNLREHVNHLINELEQCQQENKRLKLHVRHLEKILTAQKEDRMRDECAGEARSLPLTFSPLSETDPSSSILKSFIDKELPPLEPLEMPQFDYDIFSSKDKE